MPRAVIRSTNVLLWLRKAIAEPHKPSWLDVPPTNIGDPSAGSLKAQEWRILWRLFLPLALLTLWTLWLPSAAPDSEDMSSVLICAMSLTAATTLVGKGELRDDEIVQLGGHLMSHVDSLVQIFPGMIKPSHRLSLRIPQNIRDFGVAMSFWCFPFERNFAVLQRIPTNHIYGMHLFQSRISFDLTLLLRPARRDATSRLVERCPLSPTAIESSTDLHLASCDGFVSPGVWNHN